MNRKQKQQPKRKKKEHNTICTFKRKVKKFTRNIDITASDDKNSLQSVMYTWH